MQSTGHLRRPLWNVIKSIGRHPRPDEQWRGVRTHKGPQRQEQSSGVRRRPSPDPPEATESSIAREKVFWNPNTQSVQASLRAAFLRGETPRSRKERKATPDGDGRESTEEAALSRDEGKAPVQAGRSVLRRVLIRDREEVDPEAGSSPEDFESVVQHAIASDVDYKTSRWPTYKDDGELKPRYFNAYQGSLENRLMKQVKRWQNQRERYGVENARNWRSALELLDQSTPDGETRHKRRIENVTLPEGISAVWRKNAGEIVLELMQRTGSHLQALPGKSEAGAFNAVTLWGTPTQNEHARLLLPQFVDAVNDDRRTVHMYELKAEVDKESTAAKRLFDDKTDETDGAYWREQDNMSDSESELLEDALADITNAPSTEPPPIRAVWAPSGINVQARPTAWNQLTFTAYVDALTSPMTRLMQRNLYGPQAPRSYSGHAANMAAELVRIFRSRRSGPFASSTALDTAIAYLLKYNDFPSVRKIFIMLEDRKFDFTASNFDAFFEVAAREESVANFLYTLRLMIQKGMRPTIRSWGAFHLLMARRFPLESNVVTEAMRRKGMFANPDAIKSFAADSADRAMAAQLAVGKSVNDFLLSTEGRFGDPAIWLSARFVNKVSRVLLEHGRRDDALMVVRRLEAVARGRGRQGARTDTVNTFLASTMRDGDVESALAYLRIFMPTSADPENIEWTISPIGRFANDPLAINPDQITFGILFSMAWNRRHFNVARVLWRHACAYGTVSFRMQDLVRRSLRSPVGWKELDDSEADLKAKPDRDIESVTDQRLFQTLAGKFVAGLSDGLEKDQLAETVQEPEETETGGYIPSMLDNRFEDEESLSSLFINAVNNTSPARPQPAPPLPTPRDLILNISPNGHDRHRISYKLLNADLGETGSLQPTNSLLADLERAWRIDVLWRDEGLGKVKQVMERVEREGSVRAVVLAMFLEMIERGVRVPMRVADDAGVRWKAGLAKVRP